MAPDISKKTMERIREQAIRPEAAWTFLLRRSLVWMGIAAAGALAALSLSMTVLPFLAIDPHLFAFGPKRFFSFPVLRLFLPWIAFVVVFVALAIAEFRKTKNGYRHRVIVIAAGILLPVIAAAAVFHLFRVNEFSDREFRKRIPPYGGLSETPHEFWSHPKDGFLAGTVLSTDPGSVSFRSISGDTVTVLIDDRTIIHPRVRLEKGEEVRIVGEPEASTAFHAERIFPSEGPGFGGQGRGRNAGPDDPHFRSPRSDSGYGR